MKHLLICIISTYLIGCGVKTNPWTYLTPKEQRNTFDNLLASARAKYDAGQYDEALEDAEAAYQMNSRSQMASETLGYIHLALAGIAPFELAIKMSTKEDGEEKKTSNSNNTFDKLSEILKLSEQDFELLGQLDRSDQNFPLLIPVCAGEAREKVETLAHVNRAIEVICPFVSEEAKLSSEDRHQCEPIKIKKLQTGKSNFLWAFSHLTEALAFRKVLTYSTQTSGEKTNLEMRVEKMKSIKVEDPTQMDSFLTQMSSLEKTVEKLMPVSGTCSPQYKQTQFTSLLNDLISVNLAFAHMPGIPKDLTDSINKAMEKIEKIRSSSTSNNSTATNKALKGDLTKKISGTLTKKINDISTTNTNITDEQKTKVCQTFKSISGEGTEKPDICK